MKRYNLKYVNVNSNFEIQQQNYIFHDNIKLLVFTQYDTNNGSNNLSKTKCRIDANCA